MGSCEGGGGGNGRVRADDGVTESVILASIFPGELLDDGCDGNIGHDVRRARTLGALTTLVKSATNYWLTRRMLKIPRTSAFQPRRRRQQLKLYQYPPVISSVISNHLRPLRPEQQSKEQDEELTIARLRNTLTDVARVADAKLQSEVLACEPIARCRFETRHRRRCPVRPLPTTNGSRW